MRFGDSAWVLKAPLDIIVFCMQFLKFISYTTKGYNTQVLIPFTFVY